MSYKIFRESVQGAAHSKKNMPCEDYGAVYENDVCKVFVLGDGHGDSNCPRSRQGAEYICKIAAKELSDFAETITAENWSERLFEKTYADELVYQLIISIFGKWSCAVNEDYAQNPITDDEAVLAAEYIEKYRSGERIEHMYGTTFLAGLLTDSYLLLLQQGDGRCVVFDRSGNVSQPIPWDNRCFANVTTSVCDTDAVYSCRYFVVNQKENPVSACFIGSDGVEDSFPGNMNKMHSFYRDLLECACKCSEDEFNAQLKNQLSLLSLNGSRDDTTVCGIIDIDVVNSLLGKFTEENKLVELKDEIVRADERLKSMDAKLQYLKDKYETSVSALETAEANYENISTMFQKIEKDIADFENSESDTENTAEVSVIPGNRFLSEISIHFLKEKLESLRAEMSTLKAECDTARECANTAEAEYLPYLERYDSYLKIKNTTVEEINSICNPAEEDNTSTS